jgi:exodeoxyribonuclease VII small subunit
MPTKILPQKFEDAFARLSEIVGLLETGEAGLEESLELYAEGMKLVQLCGQKLSEAEKKIETLKDAVVLPGDDADGEG